MEAPTFVATATDVADFCTYIDNIINTIDLSEPGLCKIKLPDEWMNYLGDFTIPKKYATTFVPLYLIIYHDTYLIFYILRQEKLINVAPGIYKANFENGEILYTDDFMARLETVEEHDTLNTIIGYA